MRVSLTNNRTKNMIAATIATRGITRRSHRRTFDSNVLKPTCPFSICSGTDIAFFVDSEEYQSEMKDERFEMRSQYDFKKARTKKQKAEGRKQKAAKATALCLGCLLLYFILHPCFPGICRIRQRIHNIRRSLNRATHFSAGCDRIGFPGRADFPQ